MAAPAIPGPLDLIELQPRPPFGGIPRLGAGVDVYRPREGVRAVDLYERYGDVLRALAGERPGRVLQMTLRLEDQDGAVTYRSTKLAANGWGDPLGEYGLIDLFDQREIAGVEIYGVDPEVEGAGDGDCLLTAVGGEQTPEALQAARDALGLPPGPISIEDVRRVGAYYRKSVDVLSPVGGCYQLRARPEDFRELSATPVVLSLFACHYARDLQGCGPDQELATVSGPLATPMSQRPYRVLLAAARLGYRKDWYTWSPRDGLRRHASAERLAMEKCGRICFLGVSVPLSASPEIIETRLREAYAETVAENSAYVAAGGADLTRQPRYKAAPAAVAAWLETHGGANPIGRLPLLQEMLLLPAFRGGYVQCVKGFEGEAAEFDFQSFYPSLMLSGYRVPVGPGRILCGGSFESYREKLCNPKAITAAATWPVGIWDLFVESAAGARRSSLTSWDVNALAKRGVSVREPEDARHVMFEAVGQTRPLKELFGDYIRKAYEIRLALKGKPGEKQAKLMLNCLWGALCSRRRARVLHRLGEPLELVPSEFRPASDPGQVLVQGRRRTESPFTGMAPAVGPFLTSIGRWRTMSTVASFEKMGLRVVRVHTDGFYVHGTPEQLDEATAKVAAWTARNDIGELALKFRGRIRVEHVNRVIRL